MTNITPEAVEREAVGLDDLAKMMAGPQSWSTAAATLRAQAERIAKLEKADREHRIWAEAARADRTQARTDALREAAEIAGKAAPYSEETIRNSTTDAVFNNVVSVGCSRKAREIRDAILALIEGDKA